MPPCSLYYNSLMISRRKFLQIGLASLGALALGVGGFTYVGEIEPDWLDVNPVDFTLPHLSPAFEGYKLVHFSDIHMGTGMTAEQLARIVDLVNAQQPDLVAITGDFITRNVTVPDSDLTAPLSGLAPADAGVAILGNHDHWDGSAHVRRIIAQSGLIDLSNTVFTLQRDGARLHIAGVDDFFEHKDRLPSVLAQLPDDGAAILLAHEPDYADVSAATGRFDLQLSGHSHGGQVSLPLVGPLILPRFGRKYPVGAYQVENMIQYTTRGVGTIPPPIRFNCRPEITVITLHAGDSYL